MQVRLHQQTSPTLLTHCSSSSSHLPPLYNVGHCNTTSTHQRDLPAHLKTTRHRLQFPWGLADVGWPGYPCYLPSLCDIVLCLCCGWIWEWTWDPRPYSSNFFFFWQHGSFILTRFEKRPGDMEWIYHVIDAFAFFFFFFFFLREYFYRSLWRVWIGALRTSANWTWYVEIPLWTYVQQQLTWHQHIQTRTRARIHRMTRRHRRTFTCHIQNGTFRSKPLCCFENNSIENKWGNLTSYLRVFVWPAREDR